MKVTINMIFSVYLSLGLACGCCAEEGVRGNSQNEGVVATSGTDERWSCGGWWWVGVVEEMGDGGRAVGRTRDDKLSENKRKQIN